MRNLLLVCLAICIAGCSSKPTTVAVAPTSVPIALAPTPVSVATLAPVVIQSNEAPPPALPQPSDSPALRPQVLIPVAPQGTTRRTRTTQQNQIALPQAPSRQAANMQSANSPSQALATPAQMEELATLERESAYLESVEQIRQIINQMEGDNRDSPRVFFSKMKSSYEAARAVHLQNFPPPRFAKAHSLIGDGLNQGNKAMIKMDFDLAMDMNPRRAIDDITPDLKNSDALLKAGFQEAARAAKGM